MQVNTIAVIDKLRHTKQCPLPCVWA